MGVVGTTFTAASNNETLGGGGCGLGFRCFAIDWRVDQMAFPFRQPRIAHDAKFSSSEKEVSERLTSRINSVLRRRLSDRIEAVLRMAHLAGDLETAAELLGVLTNVRERGRQKLRGERRVSDDPVAKAQDELATSRTILNRPQSL
jgi:hypothetical protein